MSRPAVNEEDATRVFFVVDSFDSNEEIFETLQAAEAYLSAIRRERGSRLFIALVRDAYRETDGSWNYDDTSATFTFLSEVKS